MAPVNVDPARVHAFQTAAAFEAWLRDNHLREPEVWIRVPKKHTGLPTVSMDEAIDAALCWGWIDAIRKGLDETAFLQRFTPRGAKSVWSQINVEKVARLTAEGRMQPSGLAHVEAARADGRWDRAYVTKGATPARGPDGRDRRGPGRPARLGRPLGPEPVRHDLPPRPAQNGGRPPQAHRRVRGHAEARRHAPSAEAEALSRRPLVMGVVNVTPDSFSDGGAFLQADAAVEHALRLVQQGADILDLGAESTRPGGEPVSAEQELARLLPVIEGVRARTDAPVSVDTMKPEVMQAAAAAGATIWNDVYGLRAPGALEAAAALGCSVVLMHMQGEPRTMQDAPAYDDVVAEVRDFLQTRAEAAMAAGVARERISLDPGIGFGKTLAHNLALLRALPALAELGFPLVAGVSRKRSIAAIDPTATDPQDRLGGSLAFALWCADHGADVIRVHDVRETVQALQVRAALRGDGE